jgi:hypothetical protein
MKGNKDMTEEQLGLDIYASDRALSRVLQAAKDEGLLVEAVATMMDSMYSGGLHKRNFGQAYVDAMHEAYTEWDLARER